MNEDELADLLASGLSETRPTSGAEDPEDRVRAVRDLLADDALWAQPAPGGAEALVAALEASGGRNLRGVAPLRRGSRSRMLLGAAASAVVLVLLAAAAVTLLRGGGDDDGVGDRVSEPPVSERPAEEFAIAGTDLMSEAAAVATVVEWRTGVAIELDITGLPPAAPGSYYQGWVHGPDGSVTVGTFHMQGGDGSVELWSGVLLDGYPDFTVTLQEEGEGPASSGQVVLEGRLTP